MTTKTPARRVTTTTGPIEHVRYNSPGHDRGHLFYVGTRSPDTIFCVIGLHHYWNRLSSTRGVELTLYPKGHGKKNLPEGRRRKIGPVLLTWRLGGGCCELYVWLTRRRRYDS